MLTTFYDTNIHAVFEEALKYTTFDAIKDTFLAGIKDNPNLTADQKLAIRVAAERLDRFPTSHTLINDGPLMGILRFKWDNAGLDPEAIPALTDAQREGIFAAVMAICKGAIAGEVQRLNNIAALDTALPTDWNTPEEAPIATE